jgi:hypothetical protein
VCGKSSNSNQPFNSYITCSIVVGHIKSPHEWLGSGHSPSRRCIWNETTCVSQLKAGKHQKSLCNLPTLKIVNASRFFECEVCRRTIMKLLCLIEVLKVCGCYLVTFFLNRTSIFDWSVGWRASKNKHHKDSCFKEIESSVFKFY